MHSLPDDAALHQLKRLSFLPGYPREAAGLAECARSIQEVCSTPQDVDLLMTRLADECERFPIPAPEAKRESVAAMDVVTSRMRFITPSMDLWIQAYSNEPPYEQPPRIVTPPVE